MNTFHKFIAFIFFALFINFSILQAQSYNDWNFDYDCQANDAADQNNDKPSNDNSADSQDNCSDDKKEDDSKEPKRRALPAPFQSPPFPSAEYQGYPLIGVPPDDTVYPLMKSIYDTDWGDWFKKKRIRLYGWFNGSGNLQQLQTLKFARFLLDPSQPFHVRPVLRTP